MMYLNEAGVIGWHFMRFRPTAIINYNDFHFSLGFRQ
jgi:hypothetical protein